MPAKALSSRHIKKRGWKDTQSKARKKRGTKLALSILAIVVGLLVLSWIIQFTKGLFSPLGPVSQHRNYRWDGKFNINLLIHTGHVSVFSYNPKEEKITILNIPDETFLEVPYGFGTWQLRGVYGLGQMQKGVGGDKLLKDTLVSFLAIPIDGFLDFSASKSSKSTSQLVDEIRKNLFSGFNLLPDLKTDLTVWELLRLKTSISSVRFDKIKELDLDKLGVLEKETLPDGTQVLTADPIKLDSVLTDFADPIVTLEHKTIAVFNTTSHPQFAQKWARLITNLGGNVIITTNADKKLPKTQVLGEQSQTLKRLRQIFDSDGKINPKGEETAFSRAQVNLLLGEDYFNK